MDLFFPKLTQLELQKIQMSSESYYSCTPYKESRIIENLLREYFPDLQTVVVTDATAHVGANSIHFYLMGCTQVNSVEVNQEIIEMLLNNLEVYQLPTDHVYKADYAQIYQDLEQDVVFIDPPWGGRGYRKLDSIDLSLGECEVSRLASNLIQSGTKLVLIKAPINYQPEIEGFQIKKVYRKRKHCYNFLILSR